MEKQNILLLFDMVYLPQKKVVSIFKSKTVHIFLRQELLLPIQFVSPIGQGKHSKFARLELFPGSQNVR